MFKTNQRSEKYMLTEERYAVITEMVNQRGSIKLTDLCDIGFDSKKGH